MRTRVAGPVDNTSSLAETPRDGDFFVNCIFTGDVPWAKNWTGYSSRAMSGGQYNENVICNDDVMHYNNTDEFDFDSKTTAWLQSKECANMLNDAVVRWNAAHDDNEDLQMNCWQWQEGQYPHVSPSADYQPSVKITFVSNGGTDVISKVLEEGSSVTAPGRPIREGYYFAGWYKDEALTEFFDWENTVLSESLTLYAKWIEDHSNDVDVTPFNNKFTKEYHIKTVAQLRGLAQVVAGKWDWSTFDWTYTSGSAPTQLTAPRNLEGCTIYLDNDSYRGLSQWCSSMMVSSSYYNKEQINTEDRSTGTGKTTAEMKQQATYESWDFETVWGISASINDGYPFLRQFYPDFKEDAVLATAPAAVADLVYTGEPLVLVIAGVAEGGEVQYALGADGEFKAELPTATNAGDYTIYFIRW